MLARTSLHRGAVSKVLVANRGEIACRVFKTANEMGIKTVAVYCDAEPNSKHVQAADEAFRIGAPPAASSYLRGENIIKVAQECGADAIHPGYGFLSENADFAEKVKQAGIEWVGPPSAAIVSMGSKSESKNIMIAADVPVVPGYHGEDQADATLVAEAEKVGFPLLIKAVSGGGGKGMKIVRSMEDFVPMLHSARREAINFFKDDRVLLERFIEHPRHVECQVFCDKHDGAVFFFERDCSVQRRYQKVLEEAPAPHMSEELRNKIGDVAVRAAKAVGYVGAGTVEFIFDTASDEFFFMEMNTRLQVEHPVTEEVALVKGQPLDLVKLQLLTARGEPLGFTQADLQLNGHCIEARVFAESPRAGFLPGSGHLQYVKEPKEGMYGDCKVRVDTGFRSGDDVLVHYDPMIAKLIVWGPSRAAALRGLRSALDEYHIVGINTNVEFLKACCDHPAFVEGGVTTKFIDLHKDELLKPEQVATSTVALAAAAYVRALGGSGCSADGLRMHGESSFSVPFVDEEGHAAAARVRSLGAGKFRVTGKGFDHTIAECGAPSGQAAHIDGTTRVAYDIVLGKDEITVLLGAGPVTLKVMPLPRGFGDITHTGDGASTVHAPMPGKVTKFLVEAGAEVEKGEAVLIVEAMKMEHMVKAPCCGKISFDVKEGTMAAADQLLASIEVAEEDA